MKTSNYLFAAGLIFTMISCGGNGNKSNDSNVPATFAGPTTSNNNEVVNQANTNQVKLTAMPELSYLSDSEASNAASAYTSQTSVFYVNKATGGNRNDGQSVENAIKNLQKAIDVAPDGATILVAEGNYIGTLDCGNINITKPITIAGGFSSDFTKRDILKYQTKVELTTEANGTAKGQGIVTINVNAEGKVVTLDGLIINQGNAIAYNPKNEGQPDGVETPMMQPVGSAGIGGPDCTEKDVHTNRMALLFFDNPTCNINISNCAFVNGSNYGLLGMFKGKATIKNNIFVNITMAAIDIRGSYSSQSGKRSVVEFDHNSVLFTWSRLKDFGDMGYGLRFMPCTDYYCTNNIFGFSIFAGLDRTHSDSNANADKQRICTSVNNLFCFNKQGDLTLPGGGMFLRVKAEDFDDVEQLTEVKGNKTITDATMFNNKLDNAYVNGFLTASYKESTDYDPNSAANQWRSSMGMNQVGTMQSSATMFANRYNLQKALLVFGAVDSYGAQNVK